jgi:hypothetical protein
MEEGNEGSKEEAEDVGEEEASNEEEDTARQKGRGRRNSAA